jgi:hypothetical protein
MNQIYDGFSDIELQYEVAESEIPPAPLILRVFLVVAIFLLGAVHANNGAFGIAVNDGQ